MLTIDAYVTFLKYGTANSLAVSKLQYIYQLTKYQIKYWKNLGKIPIKTYRGIIEISGNKIEFTFLDGIDIKIEWRLK